MWNIHASLLFISKVLCFRSRYLKFLEIDFAVFIHNGIVSEKWNYISSTLSQHINYWLIYIGNLIWNMPCKIILYLNLNYYSTQNNIICTTGNNLKQMIKIWTIDIFHEMKSVNDPKISAQSKSFNWR